MELGPPAPSSKHLVGKHAWPSEGGDMGFPFLGARLFPAQSLFPASQGRNRRCCSEWKVGGVKHGHFPSEPPLVAVSLGCFWQGPCGLAPGTLLAKVGGVRDEPCVFPSPVAEEGTHPLFGLWVTFHPAGHGHPRDPSVTLLLTTARGSGAAELSLLASRETRGQGQDFFSWCQGCAVPSLQQHRLAWGAQGIRVPCCVLDLGLALWDAVRTGSRGALGDAGTNPGAVLLCLHGDLMSCYWVVWVCCDVRESGTLLPSRGGRVPGSEQEPRCLPGAQVPALLRDQVLPFPSRAAFVLHPSAKLAAAPCRELCRAGEQPRCLEDTLGLLGPRPHVAPPADVASEMALSADPCPSVLSSPVHGCLRGSGSQPAPAPHRAGAAAPRGWSAGRMRPMFLLGAMEPGRAPCHSNWGLGGLCGTQHSLSTPPGGPGFT